MEQAKRGRVLTVAVLAVLAIAAFWGLLRGGRPPARQPLRVPEQEFRYTEPTITLYDHRTGEKSSIKFETYIAGVVAAEMEPTWPTEALAAQAILARTFTLHKIRYEGGVSERGADASTSPEEFQAYDPGRINANVRRAVEMTRGMVIKHNGRYVRAWFHANAGGRTATAPEGLNFTKEPTPYIKSVSDPGQKVAPPAERSWTVSFSLSRVREAVRSLTGHDPGAIESVQILKRGPSGRAVQIRLGNATISGNSLRLALGPEVMRSTLLDRLEVRDQMLAISGRGRGHGVGMSQWGAYYLAKQGKSPADIVRYYYKGVTLEKVWR
ncbi:MAG: SpoIID/LytB domain-containing protein [Bacillota bacterium]|jgi:stage II sporulation protein D|nr:SpoIID/LytB domain-containing protein [Bacillota bacterium]